MSDSLKSRAVKGAAWAFGERIFSQLVGFAVTMILARLLTPENYGTIALLTVFIGLARVFVDGGFGQALIQKKDATELDYNSVFYVSLAMSCLIYVALFFAAPCVARFYQTPEIENIMRVLALTVVFFAVNSIQSAELSRKLLFHFSFRITLGAHVASAVVGISLALAGYGVWALVASTLTAEVIGMILRWHYIAWRPQMMFSFRAVKGLLNFGWKMTASTFLDSAYRNLSSLLIGKFYAKDNLAYINKGEQPVQLMMDSLNNTIGVVAFPVLSQLQNDRDRVRAAMQRIILCTTFFVFPAMTGCALCAKPIILFLFGDQWLPAIPFLQLACFSYVLYPFHSVNVKAIAALGRSDVFLKLEIIKKIIGLLAIVIFIRQGIVVYVASTALIVGPISVFINAWPNRKLLNYTVHQQIMDVLPTAVVCSIMAGAVYGLLALIPETWPSFVVLALVGGWGLFIYLLCARLMRLNALREYMMAVQPLTQTRLGKKLMPVWNYIMF